MEARVATSCHIAAAPLQGTFRNMHALHKINAQASTQRPSDQSEHITEGVVARAFVAPCALLTRSMFTCGVLFCHAFNDVQVHMQLYFQQPIL